MIYLDSAATSLQKPCSVPRASSYAMTHFASPGRGGYKPAQEASDLIFSCREELGLLFSEPNPENIVFTSSATHSLNIAIKTLVKPGSTVLISGFEHNAVTRQSPYNAFPSPQKVIKKRRNTYEPMFIHEITITNNNVVSKHRQKNPTQSVSRKSGGTSF